MADAVVSMVLEQLTSILGQLIQDEVKLVGDVSKEVERLTHNFQAIQAVLVDAEQRQIKEASVKGWLDRLKNMSYDVEDLLDKWNTSNLKLQMKEDVSTVKKVCSFFLYPCFYWRKVALYRDIGLKIKDIFERLDDIAKEKDTYHFNTYRSVDQPPRVESTSFIDESEIYGRGELENTLVSRLLGDSSDKQKGLSIISLVGMGGIGKTTLAQLAYNSEKVQRNFEIRIWVCVSDPFNEIRIAKSIAVALECPTSDLVDLQSILQRIHQSIEGKKFLFVLDDVWTENYNKWEPFRHCLSKASHDSKILVTTRKETVAKMMESADIIPIKELSEEHCWSLFKRLAFFGRPNMDCEDLSDLENIGRQIVRKCKGLPLAAKTMGSFMRFKLKKDKWVDILNNEMWNLKEFEEGLSPFLLLSYNDLPHMVKLCFSYCAIFPKDYNFDKDKLIKLWMAQGYLGHIEQYKEMEMIGEEYFNNLATRSFFQEFQKDDKGNIIRCKMHDIVHDFALYLTKNECFPPDLKETSMKSSLGKACHVMLMMVNKNNPFLDSICNNKRVRSLFIQFDQLGSSSIDRVLQKLFGEGTSDYCLRALEIGGITKFEMPSGIEVKRVFFEKIPSGIGKLIHLRYLDLSGDEGLEVLPETLCELYNLQTLNIASCRNLKKLPLGMGKLANLRHLINNGNSKVRHMPKGIEKLTCLRTLHEFRLNESDSKGKVCTSLECLNNFRHLRGYLLIGGLEYLRDEPVDLRSKENIIDLALEFDGYSSNRNKKILEGLQPPPSLQSLEILYYCGNIELPIWIVSLHKLRKIKLYDLSNCDRLPSLGKLSSLESLEIHSADNVKRVDNEFYGINMGETISSSITFFPKLKSLKFSNMKQWEQWDFWIRGSEEDHIKIMPSLHSLSIRSCGALKVLPNQLFKKLELKNLQIVDCPILEELYKEGTGRHRPQISHIPSIRIYNTRSLL